MEVGRGEETSVRHLVEPGLVDLAAMRAAMAKAKKEGKAAAIGHPAHRSSGEVPAIEIADKMDRGLEGRGEKEGHRAGMLEIAERAAARQAEHALGQAGDEIVRGDGFALRLVAPDLVGELVITTLTKEALPILRYRTRDLTRLLPGTARTMRRMEKITGRSDDMLIIRGVNVYPSQVEAVLIGLPGLAPHYQLVVERKGNLDELAVEVEAAPSAGTGEDVYRALAERVQQLHRELIEYVAESDDGLMEKFFEQGNLTEEQLRAGEHAARRRQQAERGNDCRTCPAGRAEDHAQPRRRDRRIGPRGRPQRDLRDGRPRRRLSHGVRARDYFELHRWSVAEPEKFWLAVWDTS